MSAAKWLLGGLGFVLGGPIGALIGVVIAKVFESTAALPGDNDSYSERREGANASSGRRTASASDIRVSLLVLIACVMKADGHVRKVELEVVKQFLVRNYGEQGA